MERLALVLLSLSLVAFVILGVHVGLRNRDDFWSKPDEKPRRPGRRR